MVLVERERQLAALRRGWDEAGAGVGCMALVSGEAGAGKSALVSTFLSELPVRVAAGSCEAASTPRPLGPLIEIAAQLEVDVALPRADLFAATVTALERAPTIVLVEDVHWVDEASADFLLYAARRLAGFPALFVLTFRDDDLGSTETLVGLVGELVRLDTVRRVDVPPLSRAGVATMVADADLDADQVFRQTSGNAFFVTELIAAGSSRSTTIRDVVLARVAAMPARGRRVLDIASQLGVRFGTSLLADASGHDAPAIDDCVRRGMFLEAGDELSFRHELARATIAERIPPIRRAAINQAILKALIGRAGVDVARLATHAAAANDAEAACRYGLVAGRRAAELSSHREAAEHYRVVARFMSHRSLADQAALLDALVAECMVIDELEEAAAAAEEAVRLWSELGDAIRLGDAHHAQAGVLWYMGQGTAARAHAAHAVDVLEPLGPTVELARALARLATFNMFLGHNARAVEQSHAAIEAAEQVGDSAAESDALNTLGCALMDQDNSDEGIGHLERALEVALAHDLGDLAGRAYANLAAHLLDLSRFEQCDEVISAGLRHAEDRDLRLRVVCLSGLLAESELRRGRWDDAVADASAVLERAGTISIGRLPALTIIGTIMMRRGSCDARDHLVDALADARDTGEIQQIAPIALALAEQAWLQDDPDGVRGWLRAAVDVADGAPDFPVVCQLESWRARLGDEVDPAHDLPREFALQIARRWAEAAEVWFSLERPYEAALALIEVNTPDALNRAFQVLDSLGAGPAATMASRRLRSLGQRVPRGVRSTTRTNPAGLTTRELDVLRAVADGRTNADIADQLFLSHKTVEHHVSRILAKLDVHSRRDASRMAHEMALDSEHR